MKRKLLRSHQRSAHPAQELRVESRRAADEMASVIRRAHVQAALLTFAGSVFGTALFHLVAAVLR